LARQVKDYVGSNGVYGTLDVVGVAYVSGDEPKIS
jgi:hypothetical protein